MPITTVFYPECRKDTNFLLTFVSNVNFVLQIITKSNLSLLKIWQHACMSVFRTQLFPTAKQSNINNKSRKHRIPALRLLKKRKQGMENFGFMRFMRFIGFMRFMGLYSVRLEMFDKIPISFIERVFKKVCQS
jgi:hypothetical protein